MDKSIIFLILIGAGFVIWIIAFITNKMFSRGGIKSYKTLAEKYNLQFDENKKYDNKKLPSGIGMYRGIPVQMGVIIDGESKKKGPYTFISAQCENPDDLIFEIVKRTKANLNSFGGKQSPLADHEFDEKFLINTNNTAEMLAIMNFNNKFRLLQAQNLGANGKLSLKGDRVMYVEPGYLKGDTSVLKAEIMLHLICDITDELKKIKPVTG